MNKLFEAVEKKNVAEVEEILKQCTQEILEFRGGMVSIFSSIICCCSTCFSTTNKSKILLFLACSLHVRIPFNIFQFAKGVYYFVYLQFDDTVNEIFHILQFSRQNIIGQKFTLFNITVMLRKSRIKQSSHLLKQTLQHRSDFIFIALDI